ncbi:cell division protein FtsL [Streptomyces sp. NBC_01754]|uniref:FtsB family cell division protein n=1 Tax=Streptomyces sp. NBC_01754 TaxID=2975930 RepID=UPI002DDAC72A|nr:cell division protein FtsL [Streptomyces sp. NBC_01754]WSC92021.1 cell division protein FtsL [Streptomyces sp. NBC_01754]
MTGTAGQQTNGRVGRLARLMPSGPSTAARAPFVLLVVLLLAGGLISLLVLNSALNEGSFELSRLERRTTELTDEQQALQRDVDSYSEPDALERRARQLGMVPGGSPAFLEKDGTVRGAPTQATAEPSPVPTTPAAGASPSDGASASPADPSAPASPIGPATASPTGTAPAAAPTTPTPSAPTSPGR